MNDYTDLRSFSEFFREGDFECTVEIPYQPRQDADVIIHLRRALAMPSKLELEEFLKKSPFVLSGSRKNMLLLRASEDLLQNSALTWDKTPGHTSALSLAGTTVLVDYLDPNATKPLHIGHLRSIGIGVSLSKLAEMLGAHVIKQRIVGDIGRAMAEMLAGDAIFGASIQRQHPEWNRVRVLGECYRAFVQQSKFIDDVGGSTPDSPIGRELTVLNDEADKVLAVLASGAEHHPQWRKSRDVVIEHQNATLERLGSRFNRTLYESNFLNLSQTISRKGIQSGVLVSANQSVVFETGRPEYPFLTLVRPDGFPTEHMRGLAAWAAIKADREMSVIHVMGDEWLPATVSRLDCLNSLDLGLDNYSMVSHRMVDIDGMKMKSSGGPVLLLDDAIEEVCTDVRAAGLAEYSAVAARFMLLSWAISKDRMKALSVSGPQIVQSLPNDWWDFAALMVSPSGRPPQIELEDQLTRWALMQSLLLPEMAHAALVNREPVVLLRFVWNLLRTLQKQDPSQPGCDLIRRVARRGCEFLGLVE